MLIKSIVYIVTRQCSECDGSEDSDEVSVVVDDDIPLSQGRQRRVVKEPTKFTPDKPSVRLIFVAFCSYPDQVLM